MACYIARRVLPTTEARLRSAAPGAAHDAAIAAAEQEVQVWQRQALIYGLYQRPHAPVLVRCARM